MIMKSCGFFVGLSFAILLCAAALAQQPPPTITVDQARQSLEEYRQKKTPIWMNDFGELGRYREPDETMKPPAPGENRVVFMGDSITDIWPIAQYFPGKPYVNRGIGGQTTPQMLIRFRPDVINLQAKVVVILAGTNDIAGNTGPMRVEDIENNYASMAELARMHNIRVVFSSVLPINNYTPRAELFFLQRSTDKILQLNAWLKNYCQAHGTIYLDYFSPMVDDKGMLRRDLADDGLHPNAAGFKLMAPLAEAAIEKALAQK